MALSKIAQLQSRLKPYIGHPPLQRQGQTARHERIRLSCLCRSARHSQVRLVRPMTNPKTHSSGRCSTYRVPLPRITCTMYSKRGHDRTSSLKSLFPQWEKALLYMPSFDSANVQMQMMKSRTRLYLTVWLKSFDSCPVSLTAAVAIAIDCGEISLAITPPAVFAASSKAELVPICAPVTACRWPNNALLLTTEPVIRHRSSPIRD